MIQKLYDTYCGEMDDSLGCHGASHETNKLQLRAMLGNRSHRLISDLEETGGDIVEFTQLETHK